MPNNIKLYDAFIDTFNNRGEEEAIRLLQRYMWRDDEISFEAQGTLYILLTLYNEYMTRKAKGQPMYQAYHDVAIEQIKAVLLKEKEKHSHDDQQ